MGFSFKPRADFEQLKKTLTRSAIPDRVPFYELFADWEIIEEVTKNLEIVHPSYRKQVAAVESRLVRYYYMLGYDYVPAFALVSLQHSDRILTEDTAGFSRGQRSWMDEHTGVIRTREDLGKYPWPDPAEIDYSGFERLAEKLVEGMKIIAITSGVLENATWLTGYEGLAAMLYEDPQLTRDLFDRVGGLLLQVHKAVAELDCVGAHAFGDDMGFKTGTIISPQHLRQYVFPWQKQMVAAAHARGKPLILHSCGNLKAVMDDLIDDVGIDAKHSYEDQIMPVWEAKKRYGDRVCIAGGIDMDLLCRAKAEDVRKHVRRVLDECAPGGGYCLGTGNSVANYINLENYLTMLDEGTHWR